MLFLEKEKTQEKEVWAEYRELSLGMLSLKELLDTQVRTPLGKLVARI